VSQPSAASRLACSLVSTPSTVKFSPRVWASPASAEMIGSSVGRSGHTSRMKEADSFSASTGRRRR
jgi:hypothetical protein